MGSEAQGAHKPKQVEENVFAIVNLLDKKIRDARRLDRTDCDPVQVLAPIADSTLDLYELCDPYGGVYEFSLTDRVVLWLTYVSTNPQLIQNEGEGMDFDFFEQSVYIEYEQSLGTEGTEVDPTAAGTKEKGSGALGAGRKAVGGIDYEDEEDCDYDDEEEEGGEEVYSDEEEEWEDAEGEDDEDHGMDIDYSRAQRLHKRKSSDPIPYDNSNNPTKRCRTKVGGEFEDSEDIDRLSTSSLRDEPSAPTLIRYPVRCEKCVQSNHVCYIALRPQTSRTCDWCRRVKKPCSHRNEAWVEGLSQADQEKVKKAVETAIKLAPPLPRRKNPRRKMKEGAQENTEEDEREWDTGRAIYPDAVKGSQTRTGEKINLRTLQQPINDALRVPTRNESRTSSSAASSTVGSRQPSPNLKNVAPATPTERSVTEIAELFERAASLEGGMADVKGQLRALHRHAEEGNALREEVDTLKRGQEVVQNQWELFQGTIQDKVDGTVKMVESLDIVKQIEVTEKRVEKLEVDQGQWTAALEESNRTVRTIQNQVEAQIQSVRREVTERDQERSTDIERTVAAMQRSMQQPRDSDDVDTKTISSLAALTPLING
ncbi:hypothetical protein EST38_g13330 [Candolleomyces aberdarensis]|uniref:Uncharacterized protein n=1 Tax=Candolleomyces aberdarensis TaxID=2316362 RepID=A0A4Q2D071_9AGAR|nr:hypothetical protein EST38_g13330 [Candolleomyces aberdarensis]